VRQRVGGEIAIDDLFSPLGSLEQFGHGVGDRAAGTVVAIDTGVDMQDGHYCLLGMDLLPRHPK
jgi:hypothetical protein